MYVVQEILWVFLMQNSISKVGVSCSIESLELLIHSFLEWSQSTKPIKYITEHHPSPIVSPSSSLLNTTEDDSCTYFFF